ncbi:uncharacterized protein TNCV_2947141 [Trichonephila clavipes]|nr:uncharacterized protein TNCV_2947141 [Trichonephila clavipes]
MYQLLYTAWLQWRDTSGYHISGVQNDGHRIAFKCDTNKQAYRHATTRGLLATDHVILNHGQVTWMTPELAPPLLTTTPHQREDVSALDRFNVHRYPTRRVFSGTGIELMTCLPSSLGLGVLEIWVPTRYSPRH